MILLENSILQLEYNPATDILRVRYPDLQRYHLLEIRHSLQLMVETIRNYDVRRLLLDASTTSVEVDDEQNTELTLELAGMLARTRMLKVARVRPTVPEHEVRAQHNIAAARQAGLITYEVGTFGTVAEALEWLKL